MQSGSITRARSDVLAEFFARLAAGESTRTICASGGDMPPSTTFWRWMQNDAEMRAAYDRATTDRAERYAEEIQSIADELADVDDLTPEQVQLAKLRCDNRKWTAARLLPKRYGDRTIVSGDADNPVEVRHSIASRLLPELAARDSGGALVAIDGGRAGSARLRVGLLGATGATAAAGDVDLLADEGGPGLGQDAKRG